MPTRANKKKAHLRLEERHHRRQNGQHLDGRVDAVDALGREGRVLAPRRIEAEVEEVRRERHGQSGQRIA